MTCFLTKSAAAGCLAVALAAFAGAADRPLLVDATLSRLLVDVKTTGGRFTASVSSFSPVIRVDDRGHLPTDVRLRFPFASVSTGKADRDRDMYRWEEVQSYPEVSFALGHLELQYDGTYLADGWVRLHGAERDVRFPVSVTTRGDRMVIEGQALLDTREYGLPVIKRFVVLRVDPTVVVRFRIVGTIAAR